MLKVKRYIGKILAGILIILCVLGLIWQRLQVLNIGYSIKQMETQKKELLREKKALQIEIATLSAPDRIEMIASKYLGLTTPDRKNIYVVKKTDR